jgi:predicted enzyme related to lactoylglutathione lyase
MAVADLDAALERIVTLGGTVGDEQSWNEFVWRTCADPEGNLFDVMQAQNPES